MNVKLRLLAWAMALAVSAIVLLGGASWPGAADPAAAVMAMVRVIAGLLAVYLFVATSVSVVVALRWRRTIGPAVVRRLVAAAVGGGLFVSPTAAAATDRPPPAEAPVLRRLPEEPATTTTVTLPIVATPTPVAIATTDEITVVAGDHLWGIAERTLAARLRRPPTDAEVVPFWHDLIELNRDRLVSRNDPDLILPGQVFELPA